MTRAALLLALLVTATYLPDLVTATRTRLTRSRQENDR